MALLSMADLRFLGLPPPGPLKLVVTECHWLIFLLTTWAISHVLPFSFHSHADDFYILAQLLAQNFQLDIFT